MVCVGRAASDTSPVKNCVAETTRMKFSRDYSTPESSARACFTLGSPAIMTTGKPPAKFTRREC